MKLLIHIAIVALLGFVLALFLPWWNVAIAGFLGGFLIRRSYGSAFLGSFLGIFLLWCGMALYISWSTGSPLPNRVAELISPSLSGTGLAIVTGIVGGLVAGVASVAARAFRGKAKS